MEPTKILTYSELISFDTFLDRFEYLKLDGRVCEETFGSARWLNQYFYRTPFWLSFRTDIILRDGGCDLAIADREIPGMITIHHLNPITKDDIILRRPCLFDPENVVCTSDNTHKAIHYSNRDILIADPIIRAPNDTCPWRK